jgi:putative ABC transport system permease protein
MSNYTTLCVYILDTINILICRNYLNQCLIKMRHQIWLVILNQKLLFTLKMIRNYFITTIRNLVRNKVFALINIFGFAIGIACVILFFLWVSDEVSYDRFHENKERTYNLLSIFARGDGNSMSNTPFPLAPTLSERHPEV